MNIKVVTNFTIKGVEYNLSKRKKKKFKVLLLINLFLSKQLLNMLILLDAFLRLSMKFFLRKDFFFFFFKRVKMSLFRREDGSNTQEIIKTTTKQLEYEILKTKKI